MVELELLAPARNLEIGIAAIDCGADSVYIAGPKFGARAQAGNSFEDIEQLCRYAHSFGAKVYITINTILYNNELEEAKEYVWKAWRTGCDAVIVQDLALLKMELPPIALFASTQTDIRSAKKAELLDSLGFQRLILARELSLEQIKEIAQSVKCQIETFIHGALCVCYSGQCYLSEYLAARSANRGECIQACRSNYTLTNEKGRVLLKDSPILSLKDFNLSNKIEGLIEAGVTSFKIEGRLKNLSYVKNVVAHYNNVINRVIERKRAQGEIVARASFGKARYEFEPDVQKSFNRGFTEFFIDGSRGEWNSSGSAKSMGEYIGEVTEVVYSKGGAANTNGRYVEFKYRSDKSIANGDGLCFISDNKMVAGERVSSCNGNLVKLNTKECHFKVGSKIYRNFSATFEKELKRVKPREIDIQVSVKAAANAIAIEADLTPLKSGGLFAKTATAKFSYSIGNEGRANNAEKAIQLISNQISKRALHFNFSVTEVCSKGYFYKTAELNSVRQRLAIDLQKAVAEEIEALRQRAGQIAKKAREEATVQKLCTGEGSYLLNSSNHLSEQLYKELGYNTIEPAYELSKPHTAELMRSKYCIKYQLGLCPKRTTELTKQMAGSRTIKEVDTAKEAKKLFLINGKNTLELLFDCQKCQMVVKSVK